MKPINDSNGKVVKPVPVTGQELGTEDAVLQAAEVQELNNYDGGQPILNRLQKDTFLLIQGKKKQPSVAIVREVLWNGGLKEVELRITELPRANDVEGGRDIQQMRQVFFTEGSTKVLAKNVLHPCKVFFLPHDYEPKTLTNLQLNRQSVRPRPGHLCWRLFDKQLNKVVPFVELPSGSPALPEVVRLVQKTYKELKRLEEEENVPTGNRSWSLPGHFLGDGSKARRPPGPERRPKYSLQDPAKAAKGKPKDAAPKQSVQGVAPKTAAPTLVGAAATEAASKPAVEPVAKTPGGAAAEAAPNSKSSSQSSSLEDAAQSLVMRLGLGAIANSASSDVQVLLQNAGPMAADLPEGNKATPPKQEDVTAAWESVKLPPLATIERVIKALDPILQEDHTKLVQFGFHKVLAAWLCALPPSAPASTKVALLRALKIVPCMPAAAAWVAHRGVLKRVVALMEAGETAVKERATALKVHWQDELEKGGVLEVAEQAVIEEAAASAAIPEDQSAKLANSDTSEEGEPIASVLTRKRSRESLSPLKEEEEEEADVPKPEAAYAEAREKASPAKTASGTDSGPAASKQQAPSSSCGPSSSVAPQKKARLKGPAGHGRRRKFRKVDELHKTLPRVERGSQVSDRAALQAAAPPTEGADEEEEGAAVADEDEPVSMEVEVEGPVVVPVLAQSNGNGQPAAPSESGARPSAASEVGPSAGARDASPEWSMDVILSLRDRLSDDDRGTLQSIPKAGGEKEGEPVGVAGMKRKGVSAEPSGPSLGGSSTDHRPTKQAKTGAGAKLEAAEGSAVGGGPPRHTRGAQSKLSPAPEVKALPESPVPSTEAVGKPAEGERRKSRGKSSADQKTQPASARKAPSDVQVFTGSGRKLKYGTFDIINEMVTLEDGEEVSPQKFVMLADKRQKASWQEVVMVAGDDQNRALGEWLKDRCSACDLPTDPGQLLMCSNDACQSMHHIYCLTPPLDEIPQDDWFCPLCVAQQTQQ